MGMDSSTDDRVLALRRNGRSFAAIAKHLGLAKASDANDAFNRALRTRPTAQQAILREEENLRLDKLLARVQSRTDLSENDVHRQVRTIALLREALAAE
jgi:hypothetical protein